MQNYNLAIASDHSGVNLKAKIVQLLKKKSIKTIDLGTHGTERVDYPDYAHSVVEMILEQPTMQGILICGTGLGMSIAANRSSQIRAALCTTQYMAKRSRQHNDANILVLGSKLIEDELSLKIVEEFLNTKFEGGRHSHRLDKIS